jgi:CRISPR/Cas system endoribonuclease Cas6 (RAMP superfamily)
LNAIFRGLGLDDFLGGEEKCVDDLELMIWYYYYSYEGYVMSDEIYNGTLSFTKGMGTVSPVMRKCYNFSEDNEAQWLILADRLFVRENFWNALKENLISSYSEVDNLSFGALIFFFKGDYVKSLEHISKMINLMII